MKDMKDMLRIVGIIVLGLLVFFVVAPLVLGAVGIVIGTVVAVAVGVIKLAVVVAVVYLIRAGVRAFLK